MSMFNPVGLSSYTVNAANINSVKGMEVEVYLQKDVDKILHHKCNCHLFAVKHVDAAKYCYKCGGKLI